MKITEKVLEKEFKDENSKNAYLKACKWLAKNVYSKVEFEDKFQVSIVKKKESKFPTFTVTLYFVKDESEEKEIQCKKCREIHTVFYCYDGIRCDKCEFNGFHKRVEKDIKKLAAFYKGAIEKDE